MRLEMDYQLNQISIPKVIFTALLLIWGIKGISNHEAFWFLDGANLFYHELGHFVFMPFGEFMHFIGGTIMQLALPVGITIYFFLYNKPFSGAVTLFWVAENLLNISIYIRDAREQLLPLFGGGMHDWNYILGKLNILGWDDVIADGVHFVAILVFLLSIMAGFYFARKR